MFDKDITVINKYVDKETRTPKYKVSHIHGFWSSNEGISISGTQIRKADGMIARILMNELNYQKPEDFKVNQTGWTLQKDDYLVKGKIEKFITIPKLLEDYQEVIKIMKIGTKDYGSKDMWHWAITGE